MDIKELKDTNIEYGHYDEDDSDDDVTATDSGEGTDDDEEDDDSWMTNYTSVHELAKLIKQKHDERNAKQAAKVKKCVQDKKYQSNKTSTVNQKEATIANSVPKKVLFIPKYSRFLTSEDCVNGTTVSCPGCHKRCAAKRINAVWKPGITDYQNNIFIPGKFVKGDLCPLPAFFKHLFDCPKFQELGYQRDCEYCWSSFINTHQYEGHLKDCARIKEDNCNLDKEIKIHFLSKDAFKIEDAIKTQLNLTDRFSINEKRIKIKHDDGEKQSFDVSKEPFKVVAPKLDLSRYDTNINCPSCQSSFSAAKTQDDDGNDYTIDGLIPCPEYYQHCIFECTKYQSKHRTPCCTTCRQFFISDDLFNRHRSYCFDNEQVGHDMACRGDNISSQDTVTTEDGHEEEKDSKETKDPKEEPKQGKQKMSPDIIDVDDDDEDDDIMIIDDDDVDSNNNERSQDSSTDNDEPREGKKESHKVPTPATTNTTATALATASNIINCDKPQQCTIAVAMIDTNIVLMPLNEIDMNKDKPSQASNRGRRKLSPNEIVQSVAAKVSRQVAVESKSTDTQTTSSSITASDVVNDIIMSEVSKSTKEVDENKKSSSANMKRSIQFTDARSITNVPTLKAAIVPSDGSASVSTVATIPNVSKASAPKGIKHWSLYQQLERFHTTETFKEQIKKLYSNGFMNTKERVAKHQNVIKKLDGILVKLDAKSYQDAERLIGKSNLTLLKESIWGVQDKMKLADTIIRRLNYILSSRILTAMTSNKDAPSSSSDSASSTSCETPTTSLASEAKDDADNQKVIVKPKVASDNYQRPGILKTSTESYSTKPKKVVTISEYKLMKTFETLTSSAATQRPSLPVVTMAPTSLTVARVPERSVSSMAAPIYPIPVFTGRRMEEAPSWAVAPIQQQTSWSQVPSQRQVSTLVDPMDSPLKDVSTPIKTPATKPASIGTPVIPWPAYGVCRTAKDGEKFIFPKQFALLASTSTTKSSTTDSIAGPGTTGFGSFGPTSVPTKVLMPKATSSARITSARMTPSNSSDVQDDIGEVDMDIDEEN